MIPNIQDGECVELALAFDVDSGRTRWPSDSNASRWYEEFTAYVCGRASTRRDERLRRWQESYVEEVCPGGGRFDPLGEMDKSLIDYRLTQPHNVVPEEAPSIFCGVQSARGTVWNRVVIFLSRPPAPEQMALLCERAKKFLAMRQIPLTDIRLVRQVCITTSEAAAPLPYMQDFGPRLAGGT